MPPPTVPLQHVIYIPAPQYLKNRPVLVEINANRFDKSTEANIKLLVKVRVCSAHQRLSSLKTITEVSIIVTKEVAKLDVEALLNENIDG
uniref:Uncharacterized protein n=1 Tax=Acrobeloides nanus TaxID=290746 RepID=A0A914ENG8_9BILA